MTEPTKTETPTVPQRRGDRALRAPARMRAREARETWDYEYFVTERSAEYDRTSELKA
ncbi:MAG: hypothetical protein ACLUHG_01015 [Sutterella wadsworthensis]